jgi:cobalt/nickel transport system permease protein
MHISDGVLPTAVSVGSYLVGAGLVAWSAHRTQTEELPKVAVVSAAFFVASLIHVPFGPTSVHLLIPGLAGALLGSSAFLAIALGLLLQSLLFQFGGLTALGANALMMGIPALFCGWLFARFRGRAKARQALLGGLVGGLGTGLAALVLALLLMSGGEDFLGVAQVALAAHVPVFISEGLVSFFTISFLIKVKPELLSQSFRPNQRAAAATPHSEPERP